ncbi:hypothetical protein FSP39_005283 [Pinctada imbricata]|uniref:RNB domain-containing protein n=1 Tax=Pinctada imbricata TaxID=66713 RepID=A0AA88XYX9_PINIB|nr:hypothetical protein FSP39_005283 [Pinctada imbricata]
MSISDPGENYDQSNEEKTLYELSVEALDDENDIQGIDVQDSQLLAHGLKLSERCKKQYCTPEKRERKFVYDAEYPRDKLIALCQRQPKTFKKCKLQVESSHGAVCTNLDLNDEISKIEISGRSKCGKAYSDDVVVVEVLKDNSSKNNYIPRLNKSTQKDETVYGHVRGVIERKRFKNVDHPVFVCVLDDFQNYFMRPLCKTVPKLSIHRRQCENDFQIELYDYIEDKRDLRFKEVVTLDLNSKKAYVFLVALLDWEEQYPLGVVIKMIKASENMFSNQDILRLQFQAPFLYKEATIMKVNSILEEMPSEPTARFAKGRKDLSDCLDVFTIDPQGSRDLDDALSIEKLCDDIYQVGVHIADVTSLVLKDDPVDLEARERATTFYQGQGTRPYHMLPEPLSNNLCSLLPGKRRLTISVFLKLGSDGKLREKPTIEKTIVRSTQQYTYEDFQTIIDHRIQTDEHAKKIQVLSKLTQEMRKIRMKGKRFAFPVESDLNEDVESVIDTSEAHALVEELMILTNMTIANFVTRNKLLANAMVLRCQSEPPKDQIEKWKKKYFMISNFVMHLQDLKLHQQQSPLSVKDESLKLRYRNTIPFQKWVWREMMQAVEDQNIPKLKQLIGSDELHPEICMAYEEWIGLMETAEYRCVGSLKNQKRDGKHFSLDIFPYTHFTSPIRRYADMMAHRLVHAALDSKETPYKQSEVETICDHLNEVTKRAKQFQKQSKVLSWGMKLKDKPVVVHGMVQKVTDKEVTLHIPGMRGLPKSCKELELNLLNVCSKPSFSKDRDTDRDILTLHWQRRIYSSTAFYHRPRYQRLKKFDCQRIDPHQRSVFQQLLKWQNVTKEIVSERHPKHLSKAFKNTDTPDVDMIKNIPACFNTELDVSSEVPKGTNIVHQKCNFSMTFNHAQVVAIQLHAEPERGIFVPSIQLLDMTRNVKCCLQHVQNPVKVFTRNATTSTKQVYVEAADYIRTWLPLVTMEAATKAVENDPAVINDLHVVFEQDGGMFSLRKSFCEKRDIGLSTGDLESLLMGKVIEHVISPDYLCIRCEVTKQGHLVTDRRTDQAPSERKFWIGHARVDKIKKMRTKGKINVHFELTKTSPRPYQSMFEGSEGVQCCVEFIQKTDDERRTETVLKFLEKASPLAEGIALGPGKKLPKLDSRHTEEAKKLGDKLDIKGLPPNNADQKDALKQSLCKSFSLIQGPPGTGKTRTAVNLLELFCRINRSIVENGGERKQIVFCGPSNKSVDVAAKKLLQTLGDSAPKCVRMYGSSLENIDYPIPGKVFATRHSQADTRPDPDLRSISLHELIRMEGKPYAEKIRACDKAFENEVNAEYIDFFKIKEYRKILSEASTEELKTHEIIFCTTAVATSPRLLVPCRGKIFQLVMDEAGMCTEPQSISAIIATLAQQVVLIGDHKQLRPVVKSTQSKNLGMETSLFERYSQSTSFLSSQYRMNPKICDFPSKQFYKSKLTSEKSKSWEVIEPLKMWLEPQIPLVFCHVEGIEECLTVSTEEGNEQSRSNKAEIDQVVKVVEHMIKREAVQPHDINVMSQYNSQCHSIRDHLKKKGFSVRENQEGESGHGINVNTVVASQGGEWDYVVFSTVRSLPHYRIEPNPTLGWCQQNLGFITDEHQINVALTRARKGLIIIGNKNLLRCEPKVWKQLVQYYERNHVMVDGYTFPRGPKKQNHKARDFSHQTSEEFLADVDIDAE